MHKLTAVVMQYEGHIKGYSSTNTELSMRLYVWRFLDVWNLMIS